MTQHFLLALDSSCKINLEHQQIDQKRQQSGPNQILDQAAPLSLSPPLISASYLKSVMPSVGEWQLNPNLPEIDRKLFAGFIVPAQPPLPDKTVETLPE